MQDRQRAHARAETKTHRADTEHKDYEYVPRTKLQSTSMQIHRETAQRQASPKQK